MIEHDAVQDRRQPLLALALRGACRFRRAHPRRGPSPRLPADELRRGRDERVGLGARLGRRPGGVQAALQRGQRRYGPRLPRLQPAQPLLDPLLHRGRSRERTRRAHRAHQRDVGRDQRRVAGTAQLRRQGAEPRRVHPLPRLGEDRLRDLRRLGLPDDAAQRCVLVHASGHRHRAGRQHRPHPRREVPDPAAAGRERGRQPRLFPVDHDPARGLGLQRLPLGLPRERQAAAGGRPADPEQADATLVRQLLRRDRRVPRPDRRRLRAPRRQPATRRQHAGQARQRGHRSGLRLGPARVRPGVHRGEQPGGRSLPHPLSGGRPGGRPPPVRVGGGVSAGRPLTADTSETDRHGACASAWSTRPSTPTSSRRAA